MNRGVDASTAGYRNASGYWDTASGYRDTKVFRSSVCESSGGTSGAPPVGVPLSDEDLPLGRANLLLAGPSCESSPGKATNGAALEGIGGRRRRMRRRMRGRFTSHSLRSGNTGLALYGIWLIRGPKFGSPPAARRTSRAGESGALPSRDPARITAGHPTGPVRHALDRPPPRIPQVAKSPCRLVARAGPRNPTGQ